MDVVMPDMDGPAVTQAIRQQAEASYAQIPVLAITANTNPLDRERYLAAGMNEVIHKPLDAAQLVSKISDVLSLHLVRNSP